MIDWLTLKCPGVLLDPEVHAKLSRGHNLVMEIDHDGNVQWMRPKRREIRSDSHKLTVEMCDTLQITGSPARVGLIRTDNVFGSGDIVECATRMIGFVEKVEQVKLPDFQNWKCKRVDVTHNYDLGELVNVRTALEMLRNVEGERYQVRTTAESVYWSVKSTVRSGKVYAKGPHMRYLQRRGITELTNDEMAACDRLLRLELSLRRHFWDRLGKDWWTVTEAELDREHAAYFGRLVGNVEINERTDMRKACIEAAIRLGMTRGYGKAAVLSWSVIRAEGYQAWRDGMARSTMYKHKKILREAGLSYADFAARNVVPIRQRRIVLGAPVKSWAELRRAA